MENWKTVLSQLLLQLHDDFAHIPLEICFDISYRLRLVPRSVCIRSLKLDFYGIELIRESFELASLKAHF